MLIAATIAILSVEREAFVLMAINPDTVPTEEGRLHLPMWRVRKSVQASTTANAPNVRDRAITTMRVEVGMSSSFRSDEERVAEPRAATL
jgi:hypothetical protein